MKDSKYKSLFILVIILLIGLVGTSGYIVYEKLFKTENEIVNNTNQNSDKPSEKVSLIDFDLSFLKMENKKENIIYSPLSIKYALKMLSEGADGNTLTEIDNVIKGTKLTKYHNMRSLSLANGIFIRDDFKNNVKKDYIKTLSSKYNASVKYDSFKNAKKINRWIKHKTKGIMENVLDENIDPKEKLILVNAFAVDMKWEKKFEDTNTDNFYLENGQKIRTPMMYKKTEIKCYQDDEITAFTMDSKKYRGTALEFIAIMPQDNLYQYIEKLTVDDIDNIINNLKSGGEVKLYIPKFSFDYELDFIKDLMDLGIKDAFNPEMANFKKMANDKLYVSDAIHKAKIDFNEKGVKAAAVTTFRMMITATRPTIIRIDHPFIFIIRDKLTHELWFIGTVYEPNLWENDKDLYKPN